MEKTIFKKMVDGEIEIDELVYENDSVLAFLDIDPTQKGHTLVITKKEIVDITDLPESESKALMDAIVKIAKIVKKATGADGINVINNSGSAAGQVVFHLHFHIIPRFDSDNVYKSPNKVPYSSREEMKEYGDKIRNAFK